MLAVLSILATLVAIVANSVGGLGNKSSAARLEGDADTIGTAADRFFTDAFPQKYPVVDSDSNSDGFFTIADSPPNPAGDVGVRLINFDASLPQDGSKDFVPDFLKEIPDSAGLVSWRIDTNSGVVFSTDFGASLILPPESDLDVSATTKVKSTVSAHTLELTMKKNEAAIKVLEVEIPAGYAIGSGSITTENAHLGTLTGTLAADNDIESGKTIVFGGVLLATTTANAWKLMVDYRNNASTTPVTDAQLTVDASVQVRVNTVSVTLPTADVPGKLKITMDRDTTGTQGTSADTDHNRATETWKLKILGTAVDLVDNVDFRTSGVIASGLAEGTVALDASAGTFTFTPTGSFTDKTLITNPSVKGVKRWLAEEQSTIDVDGVFDSVPGNQAVVITDS
jgi:hypothetical protein